MQDEPRNSSFFTPARREPSITFAAIIDVVVEELRRPGIVGEDAADGGGGDEHRVGPRRGEPCLGLGLAAQIDLAAADGQNLAMLAVEPPHQRAADHAAMARDENALPGQRKTPACIA